MAKCCAPPACQPPAGPDPPIAQPGRSRLRQDRVVLPTSRRLHSLRPQHLAAAPRRSLSSLPPSGIVGAASKVALPSEGLVPAAGTSVAPVGVVVCDLSCLVTHTSQCHPVLKTPLPSPPLRPRPLPDPPPLGSWWPYMLLHLVCSTLSWWWCGDAGTSPPSIPASIVLLCSSSRTCRVKCLGVWGRGTMPTHSLCHLLADGCGDKRVVVRLEWPECEEKKVKSLKLIRLFCRR